MSHLFEPLTLRGLTVPNRAWVSPMCQYSAVDGVVGDWHLMHLGAFAAGRAGLVMTEATAVVPDGRISPQCPGLWSPEQATAWQRVVDFVHAQHRPIGIQLAHAGRKGSTDRPWNGMGYVAPDAGGWVTEAPSVLPFGDLPAPRAMTIPEIESLVTAYADAATRSVSAGFDLIELHMAHGYLMHEFLSPLSNVRDDAYGGDLAGRMRLPLAVVGAVRAAIPDAMPLLVRISTTDWVECGWDVEQSMELVRRMADAGVDLIDASSGGLDPGQQIPRDVNYQVDRAALIRAATGVPVAAVGMISAPAQAEGIIASGRADAVFLAREMLRDPHWPMRAAAELGAEVDWVPQYARAKG